MAKVDLVGDGQTFTGGGKARPRGREVPMPMDRCGCVQHEVRPRLHPSRAPTNCVMGYELPLLARESPGRLGE